MSVIASRGAACACLSRVGRRRSGPPCSSAQRTARGSNSCQPHPEDARWQSDADLRDARGHLRARAGSGAQDPRGVACDCHDFTRRWRMCDSHCFRGHASGPAGLTVLHRNASSWRHGRRRAQASTRLIKSSHAGGRSGSSCADGSRRVRHSTARHRRPSQLRCHGAAWHLCGAVASLRGSRTPAADVTVRVQVRVRGQLLRAERLLRDRGGAGAALPVTAFSWRAM